MFHDDFASLTEATRILGCDRKTIYRMMADGRLTAYRRAYNVRNGPIWFDRKKLDELCRLIPVEASA